MAGTVANQKYTVEDDEEQKPNAKFSVEDEDEAAPAPEPEKTPTGEPVAPNLSAGGRALSTDFGNAPTWSESLGKIGDWAQKKSEQKELEKLSDIAHGRSSPGYSAYTPAAGYDLLARTAKMGSGLVEPKNVAIGAAATVAPEIVGPALVAHGGMGAIGGAADIAEHGATPENVEQTLTSGAEAVGGGAALGEIPKRGGFRNTLTGKVIGKVGEATGGYGMGLGLPPEDLMTKAVKPRARAQGWQEAMGSPGVQRAIKEADAATPIKNIEDFHDAVGPMKEKLWNEKVQPALDRQGPRPVDMKPAAKAVRDAITPEMREFNPGGAKEVEALAEKLEKSRTVQEGSDLQKYANAQLESYFSKYPSARRAAFQSNPDTLGWETARRAIREELNKTLDAAGETQTADARKDYGHLTAIEKELERKVNPNERKAPINLARTLGLLGAIPTHGASLIAGEVISHMNDPNVLLRRGIKKMNPPAEAPFSPPAPFVPPAATAQIPRMAGEQGSLNLPPENAPLFNIQQSPRVPPAAPEEPRLPPIQGKQQSLNLPPEDTPLFNIQQTPRVGEPPTPAAPPEKGPLPPIGGPGRHGVLGKIGDIEPKEAGGVKFGAGEDLGEGLGIQHEISVGGRRVGSITVEPRDEGVLHVHWLGGEFGSEMRTPIMDAIKEAYPDTKKITYDRRRLAKGAEAATTEPREMDVAEKKSELGAIGGEQTEIGHGPTGSKWESLSEEQKATLKRESAGKPAQSSMEDLEVGDTFVDKSGEPRRIMEITEDGKIHTADGDEKVYDQTVEHLGEINSPRAQLARGGKIISGPEEAEPAAKEEADYSDKQKEATDRVDAKYKEVGDLVDGRKVREHVPNWDSINATLGVHPGAYDVLEGIREVNMSEFKDPGAKSPRIDKLAEQIKDSKELNPLIVGVDHEGPWIIEGGHRFDALRKLGAKSFPAVVAVDLTEEGIGKGGLGKIGEEEPESEALGKIGEGSKKPKSAIDQIRAKVESGEHNGEKRNYALVEKGKTAPGTSGGKATFLLDDGSALSSSNMDDDLVHHMGLAKEIGHELLNKANAIRVAASDSFELHGMPSEAQLSEMARLSKEQPVGRIGSANVWWDFYPDQGKGYSVDASSPEHITGAGSMSDFRREVERYYEKGDHTESPEIADTRVDPKDAQAALGRKMKREEGIGEPKNEAKVFTDEKGKKYYFGKLSTDQFVDRLEQQLDPELMQKWRDWYPDVGRLFEEKFGKGVESAKKLMAWLVSQKNTSPAGGMMNLLRTEDVMSGQRRIKSGGLAEDQIRSMLSGETPESGLGAKLNDFVDSALQKNTRTWMGDDAKGGRPAVIDVHSARGTGYIDSTLKDFIEKKFGAEAAKGLVEDLKGAPSETQYERGAEYYNKIADELNERNYKGGKWTPDQVQAVDWAAMGKQLGRDMDLPEAIFEKNIRRIAYEVDFGQGSPLSKKFPALGSLDPKQAAAITHDVANHALDIASREAGGYIHDRVFGPGGWQDTVHGKGKTKGPTGLSASTHADVLASPEAAERISNLLGHLLQQTEVITSRPLKSGNGHAFEIREVGGKKLLDPVTLHEFWNKFTEAYPKAEGFSPVRRADGKVGIQILKKNGHFSSNIDVPQLKEAARVAAEHVGLENIQIEHGAADVHSATNDWTKDKNGEAYRARLNKIGAKGIQTRIRDEYVPSVEKAIRTAFQKHAPEAFGKFLEGGEGK